MVVTRVTRVSDTAVRKSLSLSFPLSRRTLSLLVRYCRKRKENTIYPAGILAECRASALARKVDRFAWRENNSIFRRAVFRSCAAMQLENSVRNGFV